MDGVVIAFLSAMGLVAAIGLLSPVRMLPLLVLEIAWKTVWVVAVALPNLVAGTFDDGMAATLFACAWALPFLFIVPWRHITRAYFASAEPLWATSGPDVIEAVEVSTRDAAAALRIAGQGKDQ
jgi:hypothetical protein